MCRSEYTGQCGTMLKTEEKPNQKILNTMSAKHDGWWRCHTYAHTLPSWFGDFWLHDHGQQISAVLNHWGGGCYGDLWDLTPSILAWLSYALHHRMAWPNQPPSLFFFKKIVISKMFVHCFLKPLIRGMVLLWLVGYCLLTAVSVAGVLFPRFKVFSLNYFL